MLTLAQFNLPVIGAALLIGIATGWWMFHRPSRRPDPQPDDKDDS